MKLSNNEIFATFYLLHRIQMIAITMRSSIKVKIRIFTLRSKNIEQGILKEEGMGKHLNNWRKKGKIRQGTS